MLNFWHLFFQLYPPKHTEGKKNSKRASWENLSIHTKNHVPFYIRYICMYTTLLVLGINLTINQCHRSNWPGRWISGGRFPFNRTFLNYRATFQLPPLVKHQLDWYKSVSIYWISVYPLYKEINSLIQYLEWVLAQRPITLVLMMINSCSYSY